MHDRPVDRALVDKAFEYTCDGCEHLSFDQEKAVKKVATRVVDAVEEVLGTPLIGRLLKPAARAVLHGFVREVAGRGLNGQHIGHIAREVYDRLENLLDEHKK